MRCPSRRRLSRSGVLAPVLNFGAPVELELRRPARTRRILHQRAGELASRQSCREQLLLQAHARRLHQGGECAGEEVEGPCAAQAAIDNAGGNGARVVVSCRGEEQAERIRSSLRCR